MSQDIDTIKKKIGIEALDEAERKRMFEKFVKAGGKVIEEKPKAKAVHFDREKQKELVKKLEEMKKKRALRKYADWGEDEKAEEYDKKLRKQKLSFWDKVSIYFRGLTNGVITLSGKYVNKKFFIFIEKNVIPHLQRLNLITRDIFNSGNEVIKEIKTTLYSKEKYYYELLQRYALFYSEKEFRGLLYFYKRNPLKKITPKHIEESLKVIFKKVYLLKDFVAGSFITLKTALTIAYNKRDVDKTILSRRIQYIKHALNTIFFHLLPKLYSLSLFILMENIPLNSRKFEKYLEIQEEEKVGYKSYKELFEKKEEKKMLKEFKKFQQPKIEYIKKRFEELTDDDLESLELDELTKYGIKLMQAINLNDLKELCSTLVPISACDDNDKVLITYLLLKEFEKEYSFILTSYKIRINQEYIENKRVDYKEILNSIYPKLTPINDNFQEYFETVRALNDIKNDSAMNEIEKYNRTNALEGKRSKIGFEARKNTRKFFEEIKEYLDRFINDYNSEKKLIENPEETLHFDTEIEGVKKVEDKKVIDAIVDADAFITAFIFRLEEGGDLSGISAEIKEIEVPKITEEVPAEETPEEQKGFLDELSQVIGDTGENK